MTDKLYQFLDWTGVERIVNSQEDHPCRILGPRSVKGGILISCFFPGKEQVMLKTLKDNCNHNMERLDEAGFFAVFLSGKEIPDYVFVVCGDGIYREYRDPYAYPLPITREDEVKFRHGICYHIYEKLGAHPMRIRNMNGTHFALWAPNAVRVSVVGDFNHWDGRMYPMEKHEDSGIFEIFLPKVKPGALYKYEIKLRDGLTYLKSDPYGNAMQLRPDTASVVTNLKSYHWNDCEWMSRRKTYQDKDQPLYIYEVHLGSFQKPDDGREFYNYRELAPLLADYVKKMGYTHINLMPIMEHPLDASWGYQVTGYYAPTSRYGTPQDFMEFVDYMHGAGIGVILDWVPDQFPKDAFALAAFDGTMLYEHRDPRQGENPKYGTLIYNYGRPQVSNFLIANALFWADKYHIDGFRICGVSAVLYLDYGKKRGEWIANMYGGNENLEGIEFLKHLNSMMKKMYPDVCMIAEETTAWPKVTETVKNGGLGFDYTWNTGWARDFLNYMKCDPALRGRRHNDLTFSMIYAYSENFLLGFSHEEFVHGKGSMAERMPGDRAERFSNARAAYMYMLCHPGKKSLFMGQEFAQEREWTEKEPLDWSVLEKDEYREFCTFMKQMIAFYKKNPALYEADYEPQGFEWINAMQWEENTLSFVRNSKDKSQVLLVICNFSAVSYDHFSVGVPYEGNYKEIFNTDRKAFGGSGTVNSDVKQSKAVECDGREQSIVIDLAPLCVTVFEYRKR